MVNKNAKGGSKKRKNNFKDCPERSHYEEFGEAHPLTDRPEGKRLRIKDTDETEKIEERLSESDVSSDDEQEDTDAVSKLLATFNSDANTAIDSDDEDDDDDSDDEDDDDDSDDEDDSDSSNAGEESEDDQGDLDDGMSSDEDADEDDQVNESSENEEHCSDDDAMLCKQSPDGGKNKQMSSIIRIVEKEEQEEEGEDDAQDEEDPFRKHFELDISGDTGEAIHKSESWTSSFEEWPTLKRIKVDIPKVEASQPKLLLLASEESNSELPSIGAVPKPPRRKNYSLNSCYLLRPLKENISHVNECNTSCPSGLSEMQKELFAIMSNYSDLYFPEVSHEKFEEIKTVYAVHALNHVLKTRKRVLKNTAKMRKEQAKKTKMDPDVCYRDQGYTRPKVLIILPFKHSAYRLIEIMSALLQEKNFEVFKQSRFREDFGPGEDMDLPKRLNRAEDFHELFRGNSSEDFKIGLKLTRKSLKLYTEFYQSDIIVASPLGLRRMMGSFHLSTAETDFLTSIEVMIIDQADVLMMQNWEHLLVLMEVLNKPPHDIHKLETDLTRIRLWTLEGHSPIYRQTVLFSATPIDHNRALINKCKNFTGRIQVLNPVSDGSVQEVVVPAELMLLRIGGVRDPDTRFTYFVNEVLPQYQANRRIGIMVYIPDYCDYVRLVKYLNEDGGISFTSINEYIAGERPKVAKIRSVFFDAKRQFLLYTERFHFYRRYRIKGVRHVIFYDLPTYPHFFSEICNLMVAGNQNRRTDKKHIGSSTVSVLYQQSDLTKLVGVLGSRRAGELIKAKKSIHICVIGS